MQNFASQCLDQTKALLKLNFNSLSADGTVVPVAGEVSRADEPGHAALAFGEYFRATGELHLDRQNIAEIVARTITAQVRISKGSDNGMAFACLGLLAFGPTRERNPVWEILDGATRALIDERLAIENDHHDHVQAFDIAKAVCRFSFGLTKKDETGPLVDRFMDRIAAASTGGFQDEASKAANPDNFGGAFDLYGVVSLIFIRQSLQLHANIQLRDSKLPKLRSLAEKYIRVIMDTVREDGLGWSYGRGIGAYGQMHCITLLLQALRDRWVPVDKEQLARDLVRRLYANFFTTFFDAEHGLIIVRDAERDTIPGHTTRMANFDAARYLSQWSRLAKTIGGTSIVRTGTSFTDAGLLADNGLDQYRVLHFATHGLVSAPRKDCPARPALVTSFAAKGSDGLLSFKEIFDLRLDADLVILSACDTAGLATVAASREAGVTNGGNYALDGLVRAFTGAGAESHVHRPRCATRF
jgi:hypothetical protein